MASIVGKNLVAFITGGAQGLGATTARRLAKQGAKICIADVNKAGIEKVASELGSDVLPVQCDVTDEGQMKAAVDACVNKFGAIHTAVQCSGVVAYGSTLDKEGNSIDMNVFANTMKVNVFGSLMMAKYAAAAMSKNAPDDRKMRGSIIFTSSICATEGLPTSLPYSASKGAINGMVLPMARDLSPHGIRVNAIAPGTIPTDMQLSGIKEGYGATTPEAIRAFQEQFILKYYPEGAEQGTEEDFAHFVQSVIENPFLNGAILRLDGAMRM
jgi:NAD(P)-dependent dehydrogenase (short-subunit alcohol dehydrogenase family)